MFEQFCIYHKDLKITNFCRTPSCSMPLCPECISDHYQLHYNSKEPPQIEKISATYQDVQKIIRSLYGLFGENYQNLKDFYVERANTKTLSQQLAEQKQKTLQIINAHFQQLEAEVEALSQKESSYLETQLMIIEQFIKEKNNELDNLARKIDGPKGLKYMIQILTQNFVSTSKQDSYKCQNFIKTLEGQLLSLNPNEKQIYDLNIEISKLVKIENRSFYQNLNLNNLNEKKDIHPLGRFSDMRSPYQYSQNQSALMDSSFVVQVSKNNPAPVSIKNNAPLSQSSVSYYSFPDNQNTSQFYNQKSFAQEKNNNIQEQNLYQIQQQDQLLQQKKEKSSPQQNQNQMIYQQSVYPSIIINSHQIQGNQNLISNNAENNNQGYNKQVELQVSQSNYLNQSSTSNILPKQNEQNINDSRSYILFPGSQQKNDRVLSQINPTQLPQQTNFIQTFK